MWYLLQIITHILSHLLLFPGCFFLTIEKLIYMMSFLWHTQTLKILQERLVVISVVFCRMHWPEASSRNKPSSQVSSGDQTNSFPRNQSLPCRSWVHAQFLDPFFKQFFSECEALSHASNVRKKSLFDGIKCMMNNRQSQRLLSFSFFIRVMTTIEYQKLNQM